MVQKVWVCLVNIFLQYRADTQVPPMFYQVVVQEVVLFGSESWSMYESMTSMV